MDSNWGVKEQIKARVSTATITERPRAIGGILALALTSEDMKAVACALDLLRQPLSLDPCQEEALEKRISAIIARGSASESPDLTMAITRFLYVRSQQRASAVVPFVPALLSFLDRDLGTIGAYSYYTLMILTEDAPDDLLPFADALIDKLSSPGYAARTLAVRIITALADKRPGSMASALEPLRDMTESSEEGIFKTEAGKALQAIEDNIRSPEGHGAVTGHIVTVTSSRQPAGNNWLLAILAQLMNLWRVISRSGGDHKATGLIACDLQEIAQWIEAEFPASGEAPLVQYAWALPGESMQPFSPKIISDAIPPKMMLPPLATPDRQVARERQSPGTGAQFSERIPRAVRSVDEAETARLGEMMVEVENDFSIKASQILDALGVERLKPVGKDEKGDRSLSAGEFRLALEKILAMQEEKMPATPPAHGQPDERPSRPEAKGLPGEIRRNIDDSLITANEPVRSIAGNFLKPANDSRATDIKRPECGGHPEKRRASLNVRVMKKDGKICRYYERNS